MYLCTLAYCVYFGLCVSLTKVRFVRRSLVVSRRTSLPSASMLMQSSITDVTLSAAQAIEVLQQICGEVCRSFSLSSLRFVRRGAGVTRSVCGLGWSQCSRLPLREAGLPAFRVRGQQRYRSLHVVLGLHHGRPQVSTRSGRVNRPPASFHSVTLRMAFFSSVHPLMVERCNVPTPLQRSARNSQSW